MGCTLALGVGIVAAVLFVSFGMQVLDDARYPHKYLYENKTLEEMKSALDHVVQPLVDEKHKFDIVATVWAKDEMGPRDPFTGALREAPIFSEVVFRGVTLMDKHVHTTVNLSIPVKFL